LSFGEVEKKIEGLSKDVRSCEKLNKNRKTLLEKIDVQLKTLVSGTEEGASWRRTSSKATR
jgi:hypothetical protein